MGLSRNAKSSEKLQHGDEAAALPPLPEAHPAGAPTESLRQADEPLSEATLSPNPSHPDGPAGTAGALTGYGTLSTLPEPVHAAPNAVLDEDNKIDAETPSPASEAADGGHNGSAAATGLLNTNSAAGEKHTLYSAPVSASRGRERFGAVFQLGCTPEFSSHHDHCAIEQATRFQIV